MSISEEIYWTLFDNCEIVNCDDLLGHWATSLGTTHAENLRVSVRSDFPTVSQNSILHIYAFFPLRVFVRKSCSFINYMFAVGEDHLLHLLYPNYQCFPKNGIMELCELSPGFFNLIQLQAHFLSSCAINADYDMAVSVFSWSKL